jgi:apolipoprotein N-acyltransferase
VALLQGNVDLATKWKGDTRGRNFVLYDSLAAIASKDSVDLIIWPETAAPAYPRWESGYLHQLQSTARRSGAVNLIGALDEVHKDGKRRGYNAAFQFSATGQLDGVYHKIKLVPFSERSPYQEQIPFLTRDFLQKYVTAIKTHEVQWWSNFYSGDSIVLFEVDSSKYSTLICFEAAFPEYVRQGVLKGASFAVNITNDTWFGRSPGPFQHLRITVMRAVENRIWLARCANSGISAVIDPYGRERARAGLYIQDVIGYDIRPLEEYSIFTQIGPVVGRLCWWLTAIILVIMIFRRYWINLLRRS